jgi:hypothetical protein
VVIAGIITNFATEGTLAQSGARKPRRFAEASWSNRSANELGRVFAELDERRTRRR